MLGAIRNKAGRPGQVPVSAIGGSSKNLKDLWGGKEPKGPLDRDLKDLWSGNELTELARPNRLSKSVNADDHRARPVE